MIPFFLLDYFHIMSEALGIVHLFIYLELDPLAGLLINVYNKILFEYIQINSIFSLFNIKAFPFHVSKIKYNLHKVLTFI